MNQILLDCLNERMKIAAKVAQEKKGTTNISFPSKVTQISAQLRLKSPKHIANNIGCLSMVVTQ